MNIKYLSYFVEVVNERSFAKASNNLFLCQSALSKAVKNLENELNCVLIDRFQREFSLTEEGRICYELGSKLLQHIEEQTLQMQDALSGVKGRVRVGIPPVIVTAYFAPVLFEFKKQFPEIDLQIVEAGAKTLQHMADDGAVDLAVVIEPVPEPAQYEITPLVCSESVLVVNRRHPLAMAGSVPLEKLRGESFLLLDGSYMLRGQIIDCCRQAGFTPHVASESFQWDFLTEMVSLNQGVTILPKPILQRIYLDNLRCVSIQEPELPWKVVMIRRRDRYYSEAMSRFTDFTKQAVAELADKSGVEALSA